MGAGCSVIFFASGWRSFVVWPALADIFIGFVSAAIGFASVDQGKILGGSCVFLIVRSLKRCQA